MAAEFMEAEKVVEIAKPADLIEYKRGFYQHWAIYVGDGDIVHFGSTSFLLTQNKSLVKREKLTEVAGSDLCRVNNRLDDKCLPRKTDLVVKNALQMVGQEVPYSVETWNCEHFVTWLRYYNPESEQGDVAIVKAPLEGTTPHFNASRRGKIVFGKKKQQQ